MQAPPERTCANAPWQGGVAEGRACKFGYAASNPFSYDLQPSLKAFFLSLSFPSDDGLRWLLRQEIDGEAMGTPWPIRGANVRFDGCTFDFDPEGERAIIFRADDCGEVIDLIA